jgi:Papain family cysteine protease
MKSNRFILSITALLCTLTPITAMESPDRVDHPTHGYRSLADNLDINREARKLMAKSAIRQDAQSKPENHDVITELPLLKYWSSSEICDQGNQGSCTANSTHFFVKYLSLANSKTPDVMRGNPDVLRISRSYQYYTTRFYEGELTGYPNMTREDTGASIAGALIALDKYGACPESIRSKEESIRVPDLRGTFTYRGFKYDDKVWDLAPDPESSRIAHERSFTGLNPGSAFATAETSYNPYASVATVIQYQDLASKYRTYGGINTGGERLAFTDSVIRSIRNNHPVAAGVMLDNSFMQDQRGYIPTPDLDRFRATGGHAVSIVGYGPYNPHKPETRYFKFINSWGPTWGEGGFGFLEEKYFSNVNKFQIEAYETWFDMSKLSV